MKIFRTVGFVVLALNLMSAQSTTQDPSAPSSVADEVSKLRDAFIAQQKQITQQQQAISQQQQEIEVLRQRLGTQQNASTGSGSVAPRLINADLNTSSPAPQYGTPPGGNQQPEAQGTKSPLSFKIGGADFTPGGFVDFENVFRTTNSGSVITTNFGNIPFNTVPQAHLTEFRSTAQYSRFNLKIGSKFGGNDVTGFIEIDFNGNDATNVFATTNPHTNRLRLYWLDWKHGKWEFTAGQAYGWITPNRVGVGPASSELMLVNNEDGNIQVGLTYTRANQFRVSYHPNKHWAFGVGIENPQQFVGAGQVTFPSGTAFNATVTGQFDANGNGSGPTTPNLMPDIVSKIAYDTDFGKRHFHVEGFGLLTSAKITVIPTGSTTFSSDSAIGGGGAVNTAIDVLPKLRFVANVFWSDGAGRYINGLGADAVVRPNLTGTDVAVSMVHSGAALAGFELQATPKTLIAGYYGIDYFQRNFFVDTTSTAAVKPFIGFGGPNSANSANRSVQEPTLDIAQTLWKSSQYGSLLLVNQASYLTRSPWFVAPGAPKNAHLFMDYISLRYLLP